MGKKKRIKLVCKQCEEEFGVRLSRVNTAKFCSRKCKELWQSKNRRGEKGANWRGGNVKLICEQCEKEFEVIPARADKARFCSQGCKAQWQTENTHGENHPRWKEKIKKICEQCEEELEVITSRADKARFCSHECWCRWRSENERGENHPDWKEKVKLICKQCKEEFEAFPYLANKARFCSRDCRNLWQRGENHHCWRGGISFEPYGVDWTDELKEEIRKRDEYTCAISGEVWQPDQPTFHVHHIDANKKNCDRDNLITLTGSSHIRAHANYRHWQALLTPIAKGAEMQANAFVNLRDATL